MANTILVVDDEKEVADLLELYLENEGYQVFKYYQGAEALACVEKEGIDLALLDVMLPDVDGFKLCQDIRRNHYFPIIMLTARVEDVDKINGLMLGADDYITKPFHMAVLESRIQAVLRRAARRGAVGEESALTGSVDTKESHNGDSGRHILICGGIRIDTEKMQAYVKNEEISLTSLEYRLLLLLMENKGCILQRGRILESLWDIDGNFVNDNTLTVAVKRLRRKLRQSSCITTVRGIGYRMEEME